MISAAILLFILGLCAGSFVNAVVWRTRQQSLVTSRKSSAKKIKTSKLGTSDSGLETKNSQFSILRGRSQCPNCHHQLAPRDLIPIFSWLSLKGKCRYCKKPISVQYPLVELAGGLVFKASYLFWPLAFDTSGQWVLFASWLITSIGLLALLVYDYKWMLLPNRILYPTALVAAGGRLVYILGFESDMSSATCSGH